MLTTQDIKKLKSVFATKHDFQKQGKRFMEVFATKQDLQRLAKEGIRWFFGKQARLGKVRD